MDMSLGLSLSHSLTLTQSVGLTLGQKLSLTQKLHRRFCGPEDDYRPDGDCPHCGRKLTPAEIVKGFNRNPDDYTTKCPRCKNRFAPRLLQKSAISSAQVAFYCPSQTLAHLTAEKTTVPVEEFRTTFAAVYQSALYHFGSLKAAFARVGQKYSLEPKVSAWQKKVYSFLGRLPDRIVADQARVSIREVRALRRARGVPAYCR